MKHCEIEMTRVFNSQSLSPSDMFSSPKPYLQNLSNINTNWGPSAETSESMINVFIQTTTECPPPHTLSSVGETEREQGAGLVGFQQEKGPLCVSLDIGVWCWVTPDFSVPPLLCTMTKVADSTGVGWGWSILDRPS